MEKTTLNIPNSGNLVTEKMYPVSTMWVFKAPLILIAISIVMLFFGYYISYILIILPLAIIFNFLEKSRFHYKLNVDELWFRKGGVMKSKVEATLPYADIKDVYIDRDIFDRMFGLGTLIITKALEGDASNVPPKKPSFLSGLGLKYTNPGGNKNELNFVGLKAGDAEILQNIIIKKMEFHNNIIKGV